MDFEHEFQTYTNPILQANHSQHLPTEPVEHLVNSGNYPYHHEFLGADITVNSTGQSRGQKPTRAKFRKLDLVKCARCRLDRKKCTPLPREWPAKCDRCKSSGFPCSEGKRVERKTKHRIAETTLSEKCVAVGDVEKTKHRISFDDWTFLSSYHRIIGMAVRGLQSILIDTLRHFSDQGAGLALYREAYSSSAAKRLEVLYENLGALLLSVRKELLADETSSHTISTSTLASLTGLAFSVVPIQYGLLSNEHGVYEAFLRDLERCGDIGNEFLVRQNQLEVWQGDPWEVSPDLLEDSVNRLIHLEPDILEKAKLLLEELLPTTPAPTGLYYSNKIAYDLATEGLMGRDCLGRNAEIQWLDAKPRGSMFREIFVDMFSELILGVDNISEKDILGRTLLHIAVQQELEDETKLLLDNDADPGAVTIYGTLPLHHAAAKGCSKICEMLLNQMDESYDADARDCEDKSALYYAVDSKDVETVKILLARGCRDSALRKLTDDEGGPTPLIRAIINNSHDIAKLLINSKVGLHSRYCSQDAYSILSQERPESEWDDVRAAFIRSAS